MTDFRSENEKKIDELWDYMVEMDIASDNEIGLAIALCGKNIQTLESVLFIRTGYRSLEQIREEEEE